RDITASASSLFIPDRRAPPLDPHPLPTRRSSDLARKLSLRRKRSSPNVFEMAATETITSIILIKLIRVSLGTVRHPRRFNQDDADRKSGSAGMPRPISYAVFCLKKKRKTTWLQCS